MNPNNQKWLEFWEKLPVSELEKLFEVKFSVEYGKEENKPFKELKPIANGLVKLPDPSFELKDYMSFISGLTRYVSETPDMSKITIRSYPAILEIGTMMNTVLNYQWVHQATQRVHKNKRISILSTGKPYNYLINMALSDVLERSPKPYFTDNELLRVINDGPNVRDMIFLLQEESIKEPKKFEDYYNLSKPDQAALLIYLTRKPSKEEIDLLTKRLDKNNFPQAKSESLKNVTLDDIALIVFRQSTKGISLFNFKSDNCQYKYDFRQYVGRS